MSGNRAAAGAKNKICCLAGAISGSGLTSDYPINVRRRHRCNDAAKIIAIKQISIAIFAKGKRQLRRCSARDINEHCAAAAQVGITVVERQPIGRHPVIAG